jgi:hypothetical protein
VHVDETINIQSHAILLIGTSKSAKNGCSRHSAKATQMGFWISTDVEASLFSKLSLDQAVWSLVKMVVFKCVFDPLRPRRGSTPLYNLYKDVPLDRVCGFMLFFTEYGF